MVESVLLSQIIAEDRNNRVELMVVLLYEKLENLMWLNKERQGNVAMCADLSLWC